MMRKMTVGMIVQIDSSVHDPFGGWVRSAFDPSRYLSSAR
jgi:hypothetical protein